VKRAPSLSLSSVNSSVKVVRAELNRAASWAARVGMMSSGSGGGAGGTLPEPQGAGDEPGVTSRIADKAMGMVAVVGTVVVAGLPALGVDADAAEAAAGGVAGNSGEGGVVAGAAGATAGQGWEGGEGGGEYWEIAGGCDVARTGSAAEVLGTSAATATAVGLVTAAAVAPQNDATAVPASMGAGNGDGEIGSDCSSVVA